MRLKANGVAEFTQTLEKEIIPLLRKQKGFEDEIAFVVPGGTEAVAISLWDQKENAEAYNRVTYPEVPKALAKVVEGTWSTLIEGLSPAEQKEVARRCAERTYRRGQVIFSVGDSPDALYLLRKGWVKLRLLSQEGQESIVQMFRPGDGFGEILLAVPEHAFEAVALDEVRVAVLSRSQLLSLFQSVPLFGVNFIRFLSARLAEVRQDLAAFGHAAASRRLARTLLRLAEQVGEVTPGRGVCLPRPVTHETLANLIGTSRETVSAQMRRFAQAGLLTYSGRNLLLRAEGLRAHLDSPSRPRQSRRPPTQRPRPL